MVRPTFGFALDSDSWGHIVGRIQECGADPGVSGGCCGPKKAGALGAASLLELSSQQEAPQTSLPALMPFILCCLPRACRLPPPPRSHTLGRQVAPECPHSPAGQGAPSKALPTDCTPICYMQVTAGSTHLPPLRCSFASSCDAHMPLQNVPREGRMHGVVTLPSVALMCD